MLLKVCGARSRSDVRLLASAGADLVGLWHGVPGGPAELDLATFVDLAAAAYAAGGPEPVLVTFLGDVDRLAEAIRRSGVRWVQLHAYQPPGFVRALRAAVPGPLTVVKVLHLLGGACVERRFVPAYRRAGTDLFLLDATTDDGRVGSTGQRLAGEAVLDVAADLGRPFLLAGGLSARVSAEHGVVAAQPGFHGIDVDTAARDDDGRFAPARITAIGDAWRALAPHPETQVPRSIPGGRPASRRKSA